MIYLLCYIKKPRIFNGIVLFITFLTHCREWDVMMYLDLGWRWTRVVSVAETVRVGGGGGVDARPPASGGHRPDMVNVHRRVV